ncbi:MAG: hypothetical protein SAK29_37610 [Scytonema sp. PMC 1069.18]|nr:hypothetical protein [Scytonema sp. PMC 1069.18]MEC4885005.1 hypothetical protein [Scytonema sp. PMC 1070.18]
MTESNFEGMTRAELLAYVRKNPQDTEAFHKYMDMLAATPGRVKIPPEEIDTVLPKILREN